jgi:hypothetical protein
MKASSPKNPVPAIKTKIPTAKSINYKIFLSIVNAKTKKASDNKLTNTKLFFEALSTFCANPYNHCYH